jgi:hypothetical protein
MNLLSISQNGYPKKIQLGNDIIVAFTVPQVKKLNLTFVNLDFKTTMVDTLLSLNRSYEKALSANKQLINNYENQINLKKQIILNQDTVIATYKGNCAKLEKQLKVVKVERNVLFIIALVLALKAFL